MNDVIDYLEQKQMSYRLADGANGKEALVKICPFCKDDKFHFYFNIPNKVYHCHKCSASGGLFSLKAELGDTASVSRIEPEDDANPLQEDGPRLVEEAYQRLKSDKTAAMYLHDRGFSRKAIDYFKLGVSEEEGAKWIWMPYFDISGNVVNVKKRRIDTKAFKRWLGKESTLYNEQALRIPSDHIVLCEGESDTIALWSLGYQNVVGVPTGAKGFNNRWYDQLDKYQRIYVAYDQDIAGKDGMAIVSKRMGWERCYGVKLPMGVKDINEYTLLGHRIDQFKQLLVEAKLIDVPNVTSMYEAFDTYIQSNWGHAFKEADKLLLPWNDLQSITDGFVPGDLIVLASRPGVGKTEMALALLLKYAQGANPIPVLLFSLEMRVERLLPRLAANLLGKDSRIVNTFDDMTAVRTMFKRIPMYTAYVYKKPDFEFVADTIRMAVRRYGIRFVVFDNLHFLCRSIKDQVREVSAVVQGFKLLAEELGIPIMVIARPRKSQSRIISNIDLKDSADIEGDADIVILLHREWKERPKETMDGIIHGIYETKCQVNVSKCRYAEGGIVYLDFHDDLCTVVTTNSPVKRSKQ